jgi:hypothetical protein
VFPLQITGGNENGQPRANRKYDVGKEREIVQREHAAKGLFGSAPQTG